MCNDRLSYEIEFSFIVFSVFALCIVVFFVYKIYRRIDFDTLSLFLEKIDNNVNIATKLINKKKVIIRATTKFDRTKKTFFDNDTKNNKIRVVKIVKVIKKIKRQELIKTLKL